MAMRFGHRVCNHFLNNKKISGVPNFLLGRSYCSEALSQQVPKNSSNTSRFFFSSGNATLAVAMVGSSCAIWGGWFYFYNICNFRLAIEQERARMTIIDKLIRLRRERLKSEDAYVEMLEREGNALKQKLAERRHLWDAMRCYMEVKVLNLLLEEWPSSPNKESNPPRTERSDTLLT